MGEQLGRFERAANDCPEYFIEAQKEGSLIMERTAEEETVLKLWGECMSPKDIADKVGLDLDEVLDIIECEVNYKWEKDA